MAKDYQALLAERAEEVRVIRESITEITGEESLLLGSELIFMEEIGVANEERDSAPLAYNNLIIKAQKWRDEELFLKARVAGAHVIALLPPHDLNFVYAASLHRNALLYRWNNPEKGKAFLREIRES